MSVSKGSDCYCIYCEHQKLSGWCTEKKRWCFLVKGNCDLNRTYLRSKKKILKRDGLRKVS